MRMNYLVMLNTVLGTALVGLVSVVHAGAQGIPLNGALPPAGPYVSSRPVLAPTPVPAQGPGAMQPLTPMMQRYPTQPMIPPAQQMPWQPMYGYNPGMPQQGYRPVMPPYSNTMPYSGIPNRYNYPQLAPWQQPGYAPQQGGWRW